MTHDDQRSGAADAAGFCPAASLSGTGLTALASGLQVAFASSGGVLGADALCIFLRRQYDQPISRLARWIAAREIVSFEEFGVLWVPTFQFEASGWSVRRDVQTSCVVLAGVMDDWAVATWFATENDALAGEPPALVVARNAQAVLQAARVRRAAATSPAARS